MSTKRMKPDDRRDEILAAALRVAMIHGYAAFTRIQVANEANCAESLVSKYFGTMAKFRRNVMRAAIRNNNKVIIMQGVLIKDKHALKAATPSMLKLLPI